VTLVTLRVAGGSGRAPAGCGQVRIAGKSTTSLIEVLPERTIIKRSIPNPAPPVGGIPCSRARRKSSSKGCVSSSPAAVCRSWSSKRARCSSGSFSSVNELAISMPLAKHSHRSTSPGSERCALANGESSTG